METKDRMPMAYRRPSLAGRRQCLLSRRATAIDTIGSIEKGDDITILTFGQFSMIDTLAAILRQTGPADVTVASWTAEDNDLERSAYLLEDGSIRTLRFLLDRSFRSRRRELYRRYLERVFKADGIRAMRNHAKILLVRSDTHDVVVRGSMNMNTNPELENLDITEDRGLAEFFQRVFDSLWDEIGPGEDRSQMPMVESMPDLVLAPEVEHGIIARDDLLEPATTHTIRRDTW